MVRLPAKKAATRGGHDLLYLPPAKQDVSWPKLHTFVQVNMFHFNTFGIPVTVLQWLGCIAMLLLNSFFEVLRSAHLEITLLRVIPTIKFQNNRVKFYVSANVSGEGRHTTHLMKCVRLLSTSQTDCRQSIDML